MTSPSYYTPHSPTVLDTIGYTQRVVDAILRNNPLHNAGIEFGLMRWFGNYVDEDGSKRNFLWIGEFLPADTNLPGDPPQRGISMVRDDSRGTAAFNLYDPFPGTGDGLKQRLFFGGGDGHRLFDESRQGGWAFPHQNIPMGALDSDLSTWTSTDSATFDSIFEGRLSVTGRHIGYRVWNAGTAGAAGEFRLRVEGSVTVLGPTHVIAAGANAVADEVVDVSALRGENVTIRWDARRTNAVGRARAAVIAMRNYSAD